MGYRARGCIAGVSSSRVYCRGIELEGVLQGYRARGCIAGVSSSRVYCRGIVTKRLCLQIGDKTGEAAAEMNLTDIRRSLGLPLDTDPLEDCGDLSDDQRSTTSVRRKSMEKMDLLKVS